LVDGPASLKPGQCLGPYRIECFLAAGGMGQVYRATDTRLHRHVAIKVSSARFSERFEREARVIASLNHPNICQLHDVGPNYLVMELVEGPTLAEQIRQSALPLAIARQIAEALEAAHEKGTAHPDLKQANVKVTSGGVVKALNFGLAKAAEKPVPGGRPPRCPTSHDEAVHKIVIRVPRFSRHRTPSVSQQFRRRTSRTFCRSMRPPATMVTAGNGGTTRFARSYVIARRRP
jgi:serine/threonine protein kinase